ncbi:MAG: hypothetical protein HY901_02130 [Deltaproteobacteria bacterium]|nr:hypothetical protein [Deltaproteobacteria bacterium]
MIRPFSSALLAAALLAAPAANGAEGAATTPSAGESAPASVTSGKDFAAEVKLLYRVVACAGNDPLPAHLDARVVDEHCKAMGPKKEAYQKKWIGQARDFIAKLRPAGLPSTVVYPFGGGDLISALTTYPEATDISTLSLEHAGDPRRLNDIEKARLKESLGLFRKTIWGLLMKDNSTTENLQKGQGSDIPGEIGFFLVALAEHGYEPVSLRFFTIQQDGSLHYLSEEEIAALEKKRAKTLRGKWESPDLSVAFSNSEIVFKAAGSGPDAPTRVHRHFAANLGNDGFQVHPEVLTHLESKGRISAMTKAASYLLWRDEFAQIRDYLLAHMDFMVSDSTGIPPKYLAKAGFALETYGKFSKSFLGANEEHNKAFRKAWRDQPQRELPFRYGYIDGGGGGPHLFVARKGVAASQTLSTP